MSCFARKSAGPNINRHFQFDHHWSAACYANEPALRSTVSVRVAANGGCCCAGGRPCAGRSEPSCRRCSRPIGGCSKPMSCGNSSIASGPIKRGRAFRLHCPKFGIVPGLRHPIPNLSGLVQRIPFGIRLQCVGMVARASGMRSSLAASGCGSESPDPWPSGLRLRHGGNSASSSCAS
jgi:hypothetical protein